MSQFDELPEGWIEIALEDVTFRITKGTTPTSIGFEYTEKGILFVKVESLIDEKINYENCAFINDKANQALSRSQLQEKDILFSIAGTLGRIAIVQKENLPANTNQALAIIRLIPPTNVNYIAKVLSSNLLGESIRREGRGVGLKNLNLKQVSEFSIPLPPLNEQRRIVEKIEALTARSRKAREALEAIPNLLDQFRQSVLAAAFRGDLTADWREQNPDVEPAEVLLNRIRVERRKHWEDAELEKKRAKGKEPKDEKWKEKYKEPFFECISQLPYLPEGWLWQSVEMISTKVVDGVHKKPDYIDSGIPFVTVKNLTAGPEISFEELNYISLEDHQEFYKRANPNQGDILISKDGTLGVTRVVRTDKVFSIFVSVALVKPVDYSMSEYLELAFSAPQMQMQRQMLGTGSGLQHIHLKDLRGYAVPVAPLEEQCEIVRRVRHLIATVESQISAFEDTVQEIEMLDQSILAKAFRGELVPQDPNDEPANLLLERIRAERERLGNSTKRGKAKT